MTTTHSIRICKINREWLRGIKKRKSLISYDAVITWLRTRIETPHTRQTDVLEHGKEE